MILLITYDLNRPGQNYNDLYEEIKSAGTWWHHLDSTWIIETHLSPNDWNSRLRKHMDDNDNILIIEICQNYQGWLPEDAWRWLKDRAYRC